MHLWSSLRFTFYFHLLWSLLNHLQFSWTDKLLRCFFGIGFVTLVLRSRASRLGPDSLMYRIWFFFLVTVPQAMKVWGFFYVYQILSYQWTGFLVSIVTVSLVSEGEKSVLFFLLEKVPVCLKLSIDQAWKKWPISVDERSWIVQTVHLDHCGEEQHFDLLCAACVLSLKVWR